MQDLYPRPQQMSSSGIVIEFNFDLRDLET